MLRISADYAVVRCLSACLSVALVYSVKTNKRYLQFFSPSGSNTITVFPYQTLWQYSNQNPYNGSVKYSGIGNSQPTAASIACCERFNCQLQRTMAVIGKQRRLLLTADDKSNLR